MVTHAHNSHEIASALRQLRFLDHHSRELLLLLPLRCVLLLYRRPTFAVFFIFPRSYARVQRDVFSVCNQPQLQLMRRHQRVCIFRQAVTEAAAAAGCKGRQWQQQKQEADIVLFGYKTTPRSNLNINIYEGGHGRRRCAGAASDPRMDSRASFKRFTSPGQLNLDCMTRVSFCVAEGHCF